MGLDVSVSLVIGVPLLCLGHVEEEEEKIDLFDAVGQKTGKTAKVSTAYLVTPKGRFKVGSNLDDIVGGQRWPKMRFRYEDIPSPDEWIHESDSEAMSPDKVVIGLRPEPMTIEGEEEPYARLENFSMYSLESVARCVAVVQETLEEHFGYGGPVCAVSQAYYSY